MCVCVCVAEIEGGRKREKVRVFEREEKKMIFFIFEIKKKETIKNRKSFRELHLIKLLLPKKDENEMKKLLERICIFFFFTSP